MQFLVIFVTMVLSKMSRNESIFLLLGSVTCGVSLILIPLVKWDSLVVGRTVVVLHSLYGGIYACA